ncbi:MAG TPA: cell division protein FtsZ [Chthoniobacterales bacterium]|jgi:cell division protein FtsZ|nr:cell division protein FtsZ [Chthoniobacterales bacterium]
MIQLSRNYSLPEKKEDDLAIKIIGLGGAGANALDRIVLDGMENAEMIAVNTDVQSLASSVATQKVQIGREVTRGLGAGGDPELGYHAAKESADALREAMQGARMVFICTGLGGGTGSGAAPFVAQLAHEMGALVVAFATLPFGFEGKRRTAQAMEALQELQRVADAVVCFENDRLGDIVLPKAGIHQAFAVADTTISQSVRAIINLVRRPGLIQIGFDELLAALRRQNSRCLFGFGESDSDNRAHEALALALKNPLMNRGKMLSDAQAVLVQISGGPGMTLTEVEIVMKELNRHVEDHTQILFGTSVDGKMGNRMSVTLISSLAADGPATSAPPMRTAPQRMDAAPAPLPVMEPVAPIATAPPETVLPQKTMPNESDEEVVEPAAEIAPAPPLVRKKKEPAPALAPEIVPEAAPVKPVPAKKEKYVHARQEVMQFEPITRGRFEKSEPTIVEGQDLDVPTFLRKNVRVK